MNFRKTMSDEVEVNLTPLIDVVFLLLIFFMVTTTFDRNAKIKIDLPSTQSAEPVLHAKKDKILVQVTSEGKYYVDGLEVLNNQPETLFRAMSEVLDKHGNNLPLVINADKKANYQSVLVAMDIAGRLGLTDFSLETAQSKK